MTKGTPMGSSAALSIGVGGTSSLGDPSMRITVPSGPGFYTGVNNIGVGTNQMLVDFIMRLPMPGTYNRRGVTRLAFAYRIWLTRRARGVEVGGFEMLADLKFSPTARHRARCCWRRDRKFPTAGHAARHLASARHIAIHRELDENKLRAMIRKWYPQHQALAALDGIKL